MCYFFSVDINALFPNQLDFGSSNRRHIRHRSLTLSSEDHHREFGLEIGGVYERRTLKCVRSGWKETWKEWSRMMTNLRLLYHGIGVWDHVRRWRSLLAHTLQDDLQTGSYDLRRSVHHGILRHMNVSFFHSIITCLSPSFFIANHFSL